MKLTGYVKQLTEIAVPIIFGNLGFIFIGVGDVIVAGRHSTQTLAAVSIATAVLSCIAMLGIGILSSIAPIISNMRGKGRKPEKYFFPTIKFALLLSVLVSFVMLAFIPVVDFLGYSAEVSKQIKVYAMITLFSNFGAFLHCAVKDFLQAFEIVIFPNLLTIFSVFLNLGLNFIFVFGMFGLPELGVAGLAIASLMVRYFMGISLFVYALHKLKIVKLPISFAYYASLLKVGAPIAFAILIEFVAFNCIPVIMGRVSELYAAAQNILCTLTSIPFMAALAISNAVAVKVGFSNGMKNVTDIKRYSLAGIIMSSGCMLVSILLLSFFPNFIVGLFTPDEALIQVIVPIVFILATYQLLDGLQVTLAGIFKGLKETKIVLVANFIAYWLIAIPLGTYLAFKQNLNIAGYWYAIGVAAVVLNSILLINLFKKNKQLEKQYQ